MSVITGDCLEHLPGLPAGSVALAFADPPFNIGYGYDVYRDRVPPEEYLAWCSRWVGEVRRVLSGRGSFWLATGDAYASELDVLARGEHGFHRRSWVVWHYSFGVNCPRKFTPSHTHLFHYVKDPDDFVFNADAVRVPSARQAKYADKRADPRGRLPNDVWVLDPRASCEEGKAFDAGGDVWYASRVCGTFKERVAHPCQMPEAVLERVVRASSDPGDLVLDPFAGSGTTLAAAKRLGRKFLGYELSPAYADVARARLEGER